MNKRTLAILAAITVTTIYGLNHTIAKAIMPMHVKPFGFIMIRVLGACILFWGISFFGPKQKIAKSDWPRIILCAILGMVINMLAFFKGLDLSTPINSAVLITITPIIVAILSLVFIKEKVGGPKIFGILIGLLGALGLILFGAEVRQDAPNIPLGNTLFIVNSASYGAYLIVVKTLIAKYHPYVLMKWLFTIALIINFPITLPEFLEISWSTMPADAYWAIAFVIVGTTFCTYLFNAYALTHLKASTVSAFVYLQPLIGIIFALFSGKDTLTPIKVGATAMVLIGVYFASRKPKLSA